MPKIVEKDRIFVGKRKVRCLLGLPKSCIRVIVYFLTEVIYIYGWFSVCRTKLFIHPFRLPGDHMRTTLFFDTRPFSLPCPFNDTPLYLSDGPWWRGKGKGFGQRFQQGIIALLHFSQTCLLDFHFWSLNSQMKLSCGKNRLIIVLARPFRSEIGCFLTSTNRECPSPRP